MWLLNSMTVMIEVLKRGQGSQEGGTALSAKLGGGDHGNLIYHSLFPREAGLSPVTFSA